MGRPRIGDAWSNVKARTWEDWALGAGMFGGSVYLTKHEWRRGLRNVGAATRGTGRFAGATVRTMGDFYRANSLGNKPFPIEPYIPGAAAFTILAATPIMMIIQSQTVPHIAGPMQQSAATGQFSVGSINLGDRASSWGEFFSPGFWGFS